MTEFPRRSDLHRQTETEIAIRSAIADVEALGADPLLTEAVELLDRARNKVADYVDGKQQVMQDGVNAITAN